MTHNMDDLPLTLRMPGARRLVEQQRAQLRTFDNLISQMDSLWSHCDTVRSSALRNRKGGPIDSSHIQKVAETCELGFLILVPNGNQVQLEMEATKRTNSCLANILDDLDDLAVFAHAEIGLRVLIELSLESAGHAYERDRRLPAWSQAIRDAGSRVERTVEAWRAFARAIKCKSSRRD
jgi:hypothetical protein